LYLSCFIAYLYSVEQVTGVDLSPVQPDFVPPNVEFFVDDIEENWTYHTPFDLVYMRNLNGSIKNWPRLLRQAFDHLAPGGYIELFDPVCGIKCDDDTLPKDSAIRKWSEYMLEASTKAGCYLDEPTTYKQKVIDAGFVDVVETVYTYPMNTWPKDKKWKAVGAWVLENMHGGLESMSLVMFTKVLGWSYEEVQVFLAQARKELKDKSIHAYWPVYCVYGRKPE